MKQGIINQLGLVFIESAWYNTVGFVLAQDTIQENTNVTPTN